MKPPFKHIVFGCLCLLAVLLTPGFKSVPGGTPQQGGTLHIGLNQSLQFADPRFTLNQDDLHVLHQVYEGLTGYDTASNLIPVLAKSWVYNAPTNSYTFHLRTDVYFHPAAFFKKRHHRKMDAYDVANCLVHACAAHPSNSSPWLFTDLIKGAAMYQAAYEADPKTPPLVDGIEVLNDSTLRIVCTGQPEELLHRLTMPAAAIYPSELISKKRETAFQSLHVGTGPFLLQNFSSTQTLLLRNQAYYGRDADGKSLPRSDSLIFSTPASPEAAFKALKNQQLDAYLPNPSNLYRLNDHLSHPGTVHIQKSNKWHTSYYGFNLSKPPFDNLDLRLAINYAINRDTFVNVLFPGTVVPARSGIVPPGLPNYPYASVSNYNFDLEKALYHLQKAGYSRSAPPPALTLHINNQSSDMNLHIALLIQDQLKFHLNIDVQIEVLPFEHHLDHVEHRHAEFWRDGWTADYGMPENFMYLFYSKEIPKNPDEASQINTTRYRNATYDSLMTKALNTREMEQRYQLLAQAEATMLSDAPVLLLWHQQLVGLTDPSSIENAVLLPNGAFDLKNALKKAE